VDAAQVEFLYGRLLDAGLPEVPVIREALTASGPELVGRLWDVVGQPGKGREQRRLRAAAALASYDPDSPRWDQISGKVVEDLVSVNPFDLRLWSEVFRPVRARLLSPLSDIFRDRKPTRTTERTLATNLLIDYAIDRPEVLTGLLLDADEKQFAVLYPIVKDQAERGLPLLLDEVDRRLPPAESDKEKLAKRQANAAVALLKMNRPGMVWPLLKHDPDPRVRSYLIHRFGPLGADASALIQRLAEEQDVTIRRALILSLGPEEFGEQVGTPEGKKLLQQLQEMYHTAADPGLHAAAEWLLRQWHEEEWLRQTNEAWAKDKQQRDKRLEDIRRQLTREKEKTKPQWYVNGQGQTMVVLSGSVDFMMGSPPTEVGRDSNERQHLRRIGRSFALAAKAVTVKEYLQFRKEHKYSKRYAPMEDCPVPGTDWYMAAAYCNWLSEREGIAKEEWCYETDSKGQVTKLKEKYLSLKGYRLPTEAEWEYACRAGAVTSRYYGESTDLLGKYAWFLENGEDRSWPVGGKKPNDLGLFDMHSNIFCWCQEGYKDDPGGNGKGAIDDKEDSLSIDPLAPRVLRGGAFDLQAMHVRCARREKFVPTFLSNQYVGFRPARTFP
jgi:formylglycine-generating enzyme required for sulfatase activity